MKCSICLSIGCPPCPVVTISAGEAVCQEHLPYLHGAARGLAVELIRKEEVAREEESHADRG